MLKYINSEQAPKAIGAYHHAVQTGNLVFISGQLGLVPHSGEMATGGFEEQAHQVFKNLAMVCQDAGGSLLHLVKINVFLTDMSNFSSFNAVMMQYFPKQHYPARSAIACLALPRNALVEVEGIMSL